MAPRVLIVDDEEDFRYLLGMSLEAEGYEVECAATAASGLDAYRSNHPDAVILDIFLPDKLGLELIKELRTEDPNVKIIAISAGSGTLGENDYLPIARQLQARYIFSKPFERDRFLAALRELTGGGDPVS